MARRATLIEQVRSRTTGPLLTLDAGNTLMGDILSLRSEGRVTTEALGYLGYDAMGVGIGELLKGIDVLQQRALESRFPILSSNLVWEDSGEPVLLPYTIVVRDRVRVAVVGVSNDQMLHGLESLAPGVAISSPEEMVTGYVSALRSEVDVVIVLSQLGLDADLALAGAVPGIDIIVGGHTRRQLHAPERVGTTTIVQMGYDGEWLGHMVLEGASGALVPATYEILYMRPDVPDDPGMVQLLEAYR